MKQIILNLTFLEPNRNDSNTVHQSFHSAVENVAGRDVYNNNVQNITSIQILQLLETAVKQSSMIPEPEKAGLLHQLRRFAENPYISGLSTSAIYEALKAFFDSGPMAGN